MRSRAVRWALVAVAWAALGAAGAFLHHSERQIAAAAARVRTSDLHAREATDALADLRAAEQAYVAAGQNGAFWMPKAAATRETVNDAMDALRQSVTSPAARSALDEAAATMTELATIDKRAREYIKSGQTLMAGDVIFTEAGQSAVTAAREVEVARQAEHQAVDAFAADVRQQQATALGAAAAFVGVLLLALAPPVRPAAETVREAYKALARADDEGIVTHARPAAASDGVGAARPVQPPAQPPVQQPVTPAIARSAIVLKAAADLATDFGRARDSDELARLLARVADMLDASGLVVWVGGAGGEDLRPAIAHGYGTQALAKMASVPRGADNAAAKAYRAGALQIVLSRPGSAPGAVVAPILAADGCIGALSAEIKNGGEGSEAVQAIATIVASHLATVLATASPQEAAAHKAAHA
jgi:hypothetical protein